MIGSRELVVELWGMHELVLVFVKIHSFPHSGRHDHSVADTAETDIAGISPREFFENLQVEIVSAPAKAADTIDSENKPNLIAEHIGIVRKTLTILLGNHAPHTFLPFEQTHLIRRERKRMRRIEIEDTHGLVGHSRHTGCAIP